MDGASAARAAMTGLNILYASCCFFSDKRQEHGKIRFAHVRLENTRQPHERNDPKPPPCSALRADHKVSTLDRARITQH